MHKLSIPRPRPSCFCLLLVNKATSESRDDYIVSLVKTYSHKVIAPKFDGAPRDTRVTSLEESGGEKEETSDPVALRRADATKPRGQKWDATAEEKT